MKNEQTNCHYCNKPIKKVWYSATRKYDGHVVCTKCHFQLTKKELSSDWQKYKNELGESFETYKKSNSNNQIKNEGDDLGSKIQKLGVKLTVHLTLPIILFVIGLFIFPVGLILWVIALVLFAGLFMPNKN